MGLDVDGGDSRRAPNSRWSTSVVYPSVVGLGRDHNRVSEGNPGVLPGVVDVDMELQEASVATRKRRIELV